MIGRRKDLAGHTTLIKEAGHVLVSPSKEGMEMKWRVLHLLIPEQFKTDMTLLGIGQRGAV